VESTLSRLVKSIVNKFYKAAIDELIKARGELSWSQYDLAKKWGRHQSIIAKIETCERRIDLIEYIDLCILLSLEPTETISRIHNGLKERRSKDDTG
jgi:predicted transcriptional regulator